MPGDKEYTVGDYWLCKRRDGKSPDIWQIATYSPKSRSVVYRSSKCRTVELEQAKALLHARVEEERSAGLQTVEEARVVPQLMLYIRERQDRIVNVAQSKSSMRVFIGFLMQDEATQNVTFSGLNGKLWQRFIAWRSGPHQYEVEWGSPPKLFRHDSPGVSGEAIKRNLDDVRAALKWAVKQERVPMAPIVPSVEDDMRSPARNVHLTIPQLGAIVGYAKDDIAASRWIALMLGTLVRPDAALAFDPALQDHGALLDMHPPEWRRTDKVNPWVPCIAPLRPILDTWAEEPHVAAKSRKTWWRNMRRCLGLPANVIPKTIRHTVATELMRRGAPPKEVSQWLGHLPEGLRRTSAIYAKYDPTFLAKSAEVLTTIWEAVQTESERWTADHRRTKIGNNRRFVVDKTNGEAQIS